MIMRRPLRNVFELIKGMLNLLLHTLTGPRNLSESTAMIPLKVRRSAIFTNCRCLRANPHQDPGNYRRMGKIGKIY
jgi:hypothetical protein